MGLLKIFQQNLHIYHRNDSTSLCTIHFIYILVLEDVIGSDVGGRFLLAHPVEQRCRYSLAVFHCSTCIATAEIRPDQRYILIILSEADPEVICGGCTKRRPGFEDWNDTM